jgi:GNAT superfamily N-acetyltransferase
MTIRQATLADLDTLVSVARRSIYAAFSPEKYPGNPVQEYLDEAVTAAIYEKEFANRRASFWLAVDEQGEAIGFLKLHRHAPPRSMPAPNGRTRTALEIVRIYLLGDYIGRGYGRQLMQHCLDYARQQGLQSVWLGVWEHNAPALVFYQKMGFVPFGWHFFSFGGERQRDIWLWKQV